MTRAAANGAPGVNLHRPLRIRVSGERFPEEQFKARENWDEAKGEWITDPAAADNPVVRRASDGRVLVETSLGRLRFAEALPAAMAFPFGNNDTAFRKGDVSDVVSNLVAQFDKAEVATSLDNLKDLGFDYATRAGLTISIADVRTPPEKAKLLNENEVKAAKVEQQYEQGILTDEERRQREIEIWTSATEDVTKVMRELQQGDIFNPIEMMIGSGARGNVMQVRQIAGMRGLVANPVVRLFLDPSRATSVRDSRSLSTSSQLTVHARVLPILHFVPLTLVTSHVDSSMFRRN